MGYEKLITNAFRSRGYTVTWLENTSCVRDRVDQAPDSYKAAVKFLKKIYSRLSGERHWFWLYFLDPFAIIQSWLVGRKLLNQISCDTDIVLVVRGDMQPAWFYKEIRRRIPQAELINFQYDDLSRVYRPAEFWPKHFDRVYSYSYVDAIEYGIEYAPMPCFVTNIKPVVQRDIDILFVGSTHSKRDVLLATLLKKYTQLKIFYYLLGCTSIDGLFTQSQPLPYEDYLNLLQRSRSVLDFPAKGQAGLTTRAYESLSTKTKLITTNVFAARYPLFAYGNIYILNDKELDLDLEFIFSEYKEVPESLLAQYSLDRWINTLVGFHD